ncbi:MAG: prephenate dehydratase [Lachnospiraceae bacterium]|nr:prephenate dehydratase [Lachnospiraceae bacterium]
MDLLELRSQIDEIDSKIVELYERRMEISKEVANYKIENGKKVFDKVREEEKIRKVKSLTHNDFNSHGVEELFEQIMSMSRKLQYQLLAEHGGLNKLPFIGVDALEDKARVVFQGAEGAYSQAAMHQYFGDQIDSFHVDTFRDAMVAIDEGSADFAVLPIENSTAGIVSEIYDLLVEFENYIVGEQIIKIEHCLMAVPGTKLEDIKTVYSHPQSLMQSSRYLNAHPSWSQISMQNNAFAAKKVLADQDRSQAAIASEYAARLYGLDILEKGVNQSSSNSTRFIIVTNQKIFLKDAKKVSICFEVAHESGSLYHMLSHFIYNNLNMNRIESRPIEDRNWEYRFFIDFDGNLSDSAVKNALRGLRDEARNMKILGNY